MPNHCLFRSLFIKLQTLSHSKSCKITFVASLYGNFYWSFTQTNVSYVWNEIHSKLLLSSNIFSASLSSSIPLLLKVSPRTPEQLFAFPQSNFSFAFFSNCRPHPVSGWNARALFLLQGRKKQFVYVFQRINVVMIHDSDLFRLNVRKRAL